MTQPGPALVAEPTVEVDTVSKWFGQKVAVSSVSCSFGPGVTGLLGPNGAGKTTMLRMLTGLTLPSEGAIRVLGEAPRKHVAVYKDVGLVPEENAVYPSMTCFEYVRYAAKLSGLADPYAATLAAIDEVALTDDAHRKLEGFSKGMRQRAKVAAAIVHRPKILVLDEPLNGTDPIQRAHLIDLFKELGAAGNTVIVSSHILEEVERMSGRIIAMVDGKLAAAGDVSAIRRAMKEIPYRVRVATDRPRELAAAALGSGVVNGAQLMPDGLHVETGDVTDLGRRLPGVAMEVGATLTGFVPEDLSLESVFRYLVHRR